MGVGYYPDSPLPGPKHWVLTFPHTPDNVYVEVGQEPDTATGGQGMEVATKERGSKGPRLTLTLTEDGRQELAELQGWLEENHPKNREEITKGQRSWWTESETVRFAVGLALSTVGLGKGFKS
jgi:hypothetical protein